MRVLAIAALPLVCALGTAQTLNATLDQKIVASDADEEDLFGASLARDGSRLVVGASHGLESSDSGFLYVLDKGTAGWTESAKLLPVAPGFTLAFGADVAVQGDVVVGVSRTTIGRFRVHVWEDTGAGFGGPETAVLLANESPTIVTAPNPSIAMAARIIVVGSPAAASLSGTNTGAVYVFERTGSSWVSNQLTKLSPSGLTQSYDWIGQSIDTTGNVIVSGSPSARDLLTQAKTGKLFVWERSPTGWIRTAQLQSIDAEPGERFAESLSLDGSTLAVGVPLEDGVGAVEIWTRNPDTTWSFVERVQPNVPLAGSWFGASVDLVGGRLVVGAPREGTGNRGTVYLFAMGPTGFVQQQRIVPADASAGMFFGEAVDASAGELVAGAPRDSSTEQRAGSVYAYTVGTVDGAVAGCASSGGRCVPAVGWSATADGVAVTATGLPAGGSARLVVGARGPALPFAAGGLCVQPPVASWPAATAEGPGPCGTSAARALAASDLAGTTATVQWLHASARGWTTSDAVEVELAP